MPSREYKSDRSHPREVFRSQGLAPKKWMGQNLLIDASYLEMIVNAAGVKAGDNIVEIGAGLGALTDCLAKRKANVWAMEIDAGFFRELESRFSGSPEVRLIHADVLKFNFHELAGECGKLRIVANLPYSVSSRLIFIFQENSEIFESAVVMLQKEVAERLVASPGTKEYGALTVLLAVTATARALFDIPPEAFYPRPEVTSTLIRIVFSQPQPYEVTSHSMLTRLVKAGFASRRKTLSNALKALVTQDLHFDIISQAASIAGVDLRRRGETLSPEEFVWFSNALSRLGA